MVERAVEVGPGSLRVGRFIGQLGIVPMPVTERGLGLVERIVRRHVAKLESVGWCERMAAIRGDGPLVWMTAPGLQGSGLGDLPALRCPKPFSLQTLHTVRVGWAAADIEAAGYRWQAARELARAPDRWGAEIANERGGRSRRLPDLAFWPALDDRLPVAVVVAHGPPKPRRERAAMEGWKGSIATGQYAQVRYLALPSAARSLERMAAQIGLTATQFTAGARVVTSEPPAPAAVIEKLAEAPVPAEPAPVVVSNNPRPFTRARRPATCEPRATCTDTRADGRTPKADQGAPRSGGARPPTLATPTSVERLAGLSV